MFNDRPSSGGLTIKELELQRLIKVVVEKIKLVTNKHVSSPTVDEGGKDFEGVTESGVNESLSRLQAELQGSVRAIGSADQGSDIKGDGLWTLQGLPVKVEGEMLPVNVRVGGAKPEEAQDEGSRGMQMGHKQPKVLLLAIGKGEGGLHIVSDVTSEGGAAIKEGEVDGNG
ncbi:hypothetical protein C0993_002383 [Termitomyces sp. T159_Od127]|nr:hypothetical protein C0993_002383 [Termitomyces sp. T159_Od127]